MVELMVVVVIITGLTALAIPSILKQMRDRRTRQAAEELAAVYRQARLRALGRGSAVLVRYSGNTYTTLEAVVGNNTGNCVLLPSASCTGTNWASQNLLLANVSQQLTTWSPSPGVTSAVFANAALGGSGDPSGTTGLSTLDVCFTPMGRTLYRLAPTNAFATMTGVPAIKVSRIDSEGLKRYVLIPPNGLARTDVAE